MAHSLCPVESKGAAWVQHYNSIIIWSILIGSLGELSWVIFPDRGRTTGISSCLELGLLLIGPNLLNWIPQLKDVELQLRRITGGWKEGLTPFCGSGDTRKEQLLGQHSHLGLCWVYVLCINRNVSEFAHGSLCKHLWCVCHVQVCRCVSVFAQGMCMSAYLVTTTCFLSLDKPWPPGLVSPPTSLEPSGRTDI